MIIFDDYDELQSMNLQVLLVLLPKFVRHYHKLLVHFTTKKSLVVVIYQCLCQCLDLIRDQQYNCSRAFWYLGQLPKIRDYPGDSGTVGAYVKLWLLCHILRFTNCCMCTVATGSRLAKQVVHTIFLYVHICMHVYLKVRPFSIAIPYTLIITTKDQFSHYFFTAYSIILQRHHAVTYLTIILRSGGFLVIVLIPVLYCNCDHYIGLIISRNQSHAIT